MTGFFAQRFFARQRFGRSQLLAGSLLLVFVAQAAWLVHQSLKRPRIAAEQEFRLQEGLAQWKGGTAAGTPPHLQNENADLGELDIEPPRLEANDGFDAEHSPLWYLVGAAPVAGWNGPFPIPDSPGFELWTWLTHIPFLACGVALGASLWYVARRLCGNQGGFIALILYCFSPAMIRASALWHTDPEIFAAWGAFGAVFTAIAVAHTLYAPREVVLWNMRRIVLLGISLWIAVGSEFSMIVVAPLALVFLLYVAPIRRGAALVIWLAACTVGWLALFATYFFHVQSFAEGVRHAVFWEASWRGFALLAVYKQVAIEVGRASPALMLAVPTALATYVAWPRTRYFGNTAPLLVAVLFLGSAIAHAHAGGFAFLLAAFPFIFIFVSGVLADLIETPYRSLVTASVAAMLVSYAVFCLISLVRAPIG